VSPPGPTVYAVTATTGINGLACISNTNVNITIYANPTITATPDRTLTCRFEDNFLMGGGGATYVWTGPGTAPLNGTTVTVVPPNQVNTYTVVGTDANGCVGNTTVTVRVSECVGINEKRNDAFVVYPNPNNGMFTISTDAAVELSLINEVGQLIKTIQVDETRNVNVSNVSPGVYFLVGSKNGVEIRQKILITNSN
jgi:hypothetical protein